jgi:CBS domain-containing protein
MLLIRDLLRNRSEPHVLDKNVSVREAAGFLRKHRIGGAPVVDGGKLVGFCSERDLVFRVVADQRDPETVTVEDIMTREVVTARPEDRVEEGEAKLRQAHCRHLPIVEDERVVGCVSLRDFLQSDLKEAELELQQLREYIQGAG